MRRHFEYRETAVTIIAEEWAVPVGEKAILQARYDLEAFIAKDPFFATTLETYPCGSEAPKMVRRMCHAAELAGVGPMAAVAGTISWMAVDAMAASSATHVIVENGGDIAMRTERETRVGIFSGNDALPALAMVIPPTGDDVLGICTSSGRVGPSLSFGDADACTILSHDVALADACATSMGNKVVNGPQAGLDWVIAIPGIISALAVRDDRLGIVGDLPELIEARVDPDMASRVLF